MRGDDAAMAMTGQEGRDEDVRLRAWTDFVLSYNRLMAVLEREMQDGTGITLSQYDVLLRLAEAPGGRLKMSDLAQAIVYSTGGLTRLFERMRRAGLVRREPSQDDRRVIYAVLTDDGMERLRAASAVHLAGVRRHFAAQLADGEAGVVAAFLGRLHASTLTCEPPSGAGMSAGTVLDLQITLPLSDPSGPEWPRTSALLTSSRS